MRRGFKATHSIYLRGGQGATKIDGKAWKERFFPPRGRHINLRVLLLIVVGALAPSSVIAQTQNYFGTSGTISGNVWSTNPLGPYTSALNSTGGAVINFGNTVTSITGASITVVGINATANVGGWAAGGTLGTGGTVATVDVADGITLDMGSQSFSTAAGTGFIKNGAGVWATAGNTFTGGFTLNAGTVVLRGVNSMGGGTGNTLTINGGTIAASASRDLTGKYTNGINIGGDFTLGATTGLALSTANITFSNNMALGAATRTITLGGTGNYTLGGVISGAAGTGLTINSTAAGTLILTGTNSYTGLTTIGSGATLQFGTGGTSGNASSSSGIVNNGTLIINRSSNVTLVPGAISGTGQFIKRGTGSWQMSSGSTYSGATSIEVGTLQAGATNGLSANSDVTIAAGAALDLNGFSNVIKSLSGAGTVNNASANVGTPTLTISHTSGTTTFSGNIADVTNFLRIAKSGDSTQVLSGNNTYSGNTTVNGGTLVLGSSTALGFGGSSAPGVTPGITTINSGGTIDLNGQTAVNEQLTVNGTGFGSNGALINSSTTPAVLDTGLASIAVTGAGAGYSSIPGVTITGGGGAGAAATAILGVSTASFTINGGTTVYSAAPTVTITGGGGTGATATANLTAGIVTSITINKPGLGFTAAPTITFTGGTVTTAGTDPTGTGNATNFTLQGIALASAGTGYTSAPTISFSGGNTTATATANVSSLSLQTTSSIGGTGDITIHSVISGSGSAGLTKVGSGTVTLTGSSSFSGGVSVDQGTLAVTGTLDSDGGFSVASGATLKGTGTVLDTITLNSGATIAPGNSPGNLTGSNTTFTAGSIYEFELNDAGGVAGPTGIQTGWDLLTLLGTLTIDSSVTSSTPVIVKLKSLTTANVAGVADNFNPASNYTWSFITANAVAGVFASDKFQLDDSGFLNSYTGTFSFGMSGNTLNLIYTGGVAAVPEPSSILLASAALAGFLPYYRRRRRLRKQAEVPADRAAI